MTRTSSGLGPTPRPIVAPEGYGFDREGGLLAWADVRERLADTSTYWLATTSSGGGPHLTPVWGVWVDDRFFLNGRRQAKWVRNLEHHNGAAIHLADADDVVIVEGAIHRITSDPELARKIADRWEMKYGSPAPAADRRGIFRMSPRSARAWTSGLRHGTSWRFRDDEEWHRASHA